MLNTQLNGFRNLSFVWILIIFSCSNDNGQIDPNLNEDMDNDAIVR